MARLSSAKAPTAVRIRSRPLEIEGLLETETFVFTELLQRWVCLISREQKRAVIERVIERGSEEEKAEIRRFYGDKAFNKIAGALNSSLGFVDFERADEDFTPICLKGEALGVDQVGFC